MRAHRHIPFGGKRLERADMIEVSVDQNDRFRRAPPKSRLRRKAYRSCRSHDAGIDQHPSQVVRQAKEDDVDNRGLAVREIRYDLARVVVAMLVSLRMLGTGALRERNLVHAHHSLLDGVICREPPVSLSNLCARRSFLTWWKHYHQHG